MDLAINLDSYERTSNSTYEYGQIVLRHLGANTELLEKQQIDTLKSDSELYLIIYVGFAQSESESISKNITWTYRKNFEDGKAIFIYKKLLGYLRAKTVIPKSYRSKQSSWRASSICSSRACRCN